MTQRIAVTVFIVVSVLLSALFFPPSVRAASLGEIGETLREGQIETGGDPRFGMGAGGERAAMKDDLVTKLDKLLAEIKSIRPDIDSVPVGLVKPVQAGSDEASIEKYTVAMRKYRRASLIKKAFADFAAGKDEEAFGEFKFVYSEFAANEKALCFMMLCRIKQKSMVEAFELAEELLDILKQDAGLEELYDKVAKDAAAIEADTGEANLGAGELKRLNERLEESLKRVLDIYPRIANIPKKPGKEKESKNKIDDNFYELAHDKRAERLKMLQDARELFDAGKYEHAYAAFKKRLDERPLSVRAMYYMALCKMKLNRPDEALKLIASMVEIIKGRRDMRDSKEEVFDELGLDSKGNKKKDDGGKKNGEDGADGDKKPGRDGDDNGGKASEGKGFRPNGLLAVPTRAQCAPENGSLGGSLCGPTSLAMALEFYGIKKTTLNVARETKSINSSMQFVGTYCENIAAAAQRFMPGSSMRNNLTTDDLARITSGGRPVIVNVNTQGYWPGGHYMVCTGVKNGTVYINDPGNGSKRTYSISQFNAQWATRSNRAVIVQP